VKAKNSGPNTWPKEAALIPNPIRKVLSIFWSCEVRALLMGGQACVFYGAAEFSRDTDFAVLADDDNLARIGRAIAELRGEVIAVPPFDPEYLFRGHAVHFRCHHPEALRMRVDVMAKMRGVAPFPELWDRRTTLEGEDGTRYDLLSLPDLVIAKKTQRDKDWPMIRRLLEADYAASGGNPTPAQVRFWLKESRTPEMLMDLARRFPAEFGAVEAIRPLLRQSLNMDRLEVLLAEEENAERAADREYWTPLKRELEAMRSAL
jgi:hypothetical protein